MSIVGERPLTELVSIIVPVHNQGDHIGRILAEYRSALDEVTVPYELLVVPNACRDRSEEICRAHADAHPEIRVLASELGGWGRAVRLGLEHARGSLLMYTNSARTAPEDLVSMLGYALANPEVVVKANRKIRDSWLRRVGSLLFNLECRALLDLSTWDINGTPKIFPRAFQDLLKISRDDDLFDLEFMSLCRKNCYPILEVPTFSSRRHGSRSTTNFRSALRLYWGALRLCLALRRQCQ